MSESSNSAVIVAASGGELVGYVEAEGGRYRRNRHVAYIVLGVRASWSGQGIGSALMAALVQWADGASMQRLELTVRADNDRARRVYERAGFTSEGIRRGSLCVDGALLDEIAMARLG